MVDEASGFEGRLREVKRRIAWAAEEAGRASADVTLIAVAKTFGVEAVEEALAAGQRVFGENKVQEAKGKYAGLREAWPDLELHLIGPLQSNKAREAVETFDVIHSVDRDKIAGALGREMRALGKAPLLFVQVNTGEEPQKAGVSPKEAEAFVGRCRGEHGLEIYGLMCIPPAEEPPSPHFGVLRALRDRLGLKGLSMGMSGDFEQAVALGATHVRVGSAIFGVRD